jgi:mevalonate kinase
LEQAHRATDEAVQATTQRFAAELAQMREIAQAMRDKLDTERGELNQRVQAAVQRLEAENVQLRSTIQTMRDSMENPKQ